MTCRQAGGSIGAPEVPHPGVEDFIRTGRHRAHIELRSGTEIPPRSTRGVGSGAVSQLSADLRLFQSRGTSHSCAQASSSGLSMLITCSSLTVTSTAESSNIAQHSPLLSRDSYRIPAKMGSESTLMAV